MASGALGALLQLSSPALPVGAYSYSQGLESAIEGGIVTDAKSAQRWIEESLKLVLGRFEAPVWWRLRDACDDQDSDSFAKWNALFVATRESRELRAETLQMGYSLKCLLQDLGVGDLGVDGPVHEVAELCYPAAHAHASACWNIPASAALYGYLFGWAENQIAAALKAVPLGQVAGQRMLLALRRSVSDVVESSRRLDDADLTTQAPMLAILSSRHEIQYSRLFRS